MSNRTTPAIPELSVSICTHNPRADYLARTLAGLRAQTLAPDRWELLIIDNASTPALAPDLAWHPRARTVREASLGLTPARLRAIAESAADTLVFVDDDNVLHPDYLERTLALGARWPQLGTWGGQTIPEFEEQPEEWTREYWLWLAIREFSGDRWSNVPMEHAALPYGAGMTARRVVAEAYRDKLAADPTLRMLDRSGHALLGGGDADLSFTGCDLGFGNGIFAELKLTHLMPRRRFEESYLRRLVEAMTYSQTMLFHLRGVSPIRPSRSQRLLRWWEHRHLPPRVRRFEQAQGEGRRAAQEDIARLRRGEPLVGLRAAS